MDNKSGISLDKVSDYLGKEMSVELKNHHVLKGTMVFYHFTEQMIHLKNWKQYDEEGNLVKFGEFVIVNRTAWYQLRHP